MLLKDVDGPFDFQGLLRKSNVLPTATLRLRRGSRSHVSKLGQESDQTIQNLSNAVNL